jgi:hypothetical protein
MAITTTLNKLPISLLDVSDVTMLHERYYKTDNWLIDTFFSKTRLVNNTTVQLGEIETEEPLAPFVSPCIEGRLITQIGAAKVTSVKPAYLKPKEIITPCSLENSELFDILRESGIISNRNTMQDRWRTAQFQKMANLRTSIDNRLTLMAAENLITGKNIIESSDYVRDVIDFGRDVNATFTPATPWNVSTTATPVQDINNMVVRFNDLTGQAPSIALTTTSVWNALVKHNDFNDTYVKPYAGITVPFPATVMANYNQAKYMGSLPGTDIQIWVYDAKYKENGIFKRFIPASYFGLIGGGQGTTAFCQIQDPEAGDVAVKYFDKIWNNPDPAGIHLMCQSSPLIIPSNKNMAVGGTGFII